MANGGNKLIETDRLKMRPPRAADAGWMAAEIAQPEVQHMLTSPPHPYRPSHAKEWIAGTIGLGGHFVIETDEPVGVVTLLRHLPAGELGYWLARDHWGNGYMTEAAGAVLADHFERSADTVPSGHITDNSGSANVLTKLGFREAGNTTVFCHYRGCDVNVQQMQLTARQWANRPAALPWDPHLSTERLVLDRLTEADLPVVQAEWGEPQVARMTATVKAGWNRTEAMDWIAARARHSADGFGLAIRRASDGRLLGYIGMGGTPKNLGYMLGRDHWGRGYATEAASAFLHHAFSRFPDLDVIEAGVFDDNPASIRVLGKLGFRGEGAGDCKSVARVEAAANSLYRLTRTAFEAST
ncbi:MAG: GNAT family N-acetyltransferase [Rhodobacteraceae bacterium]|nr:GNAT family N-acetyltransferase [Paracoccaceae bacterium]